MTQIQSVVPRENYRLEVQFENGSSVTLDFGSRLHTIRFGLFADPSFFQCAVTDGTLVTWEDKIELSVSEIFQLAQK